MKERYHLKSQVGGSSILTTKHDTHIQAHKHFGEVLGRMLTIDQESPWAVHIWDDLEGDTVLLCTNRAELKPTARMKWPPICLENGTSYREVKGIYPETATRQEDGTLSPWTPDSPASEAEDILVLSHRDPREGERLFDDDLIDNWLFNYADFWQECGPDSCG